MIGGKEMKKNVIFILCSLFLVFLSIATVNAVSRTCKIGGRYYRHGQTTVDLMDNGLLYRCTCYVSSNGKSRRYCNESREDAQMLIADTSHIRKVLLGGVKGFAKDYIKGLRGIAVSVDVDYKRNYVFWTDVSSKGRGIYRASLSDIGRITQIISEEIYEPNGLAVDWLSSNIYWTDAQLGAIFVADYKGENRVRLVGGLSEPRGIALLPREGLMFWSDQTRGTIERAAMDGSKHQIIVADLIWPNEVTVDRMMRKVYWLDGSTQTIMSSNFDGKETTTIYDFTLTFHSPGFGLSYFNNRLYFGVWNKRFIYSVTSIGQNLQPTVSNIGAKPMGMVIANTQLQTHNRITNVCWRNQRHCSHLCLPISASEFRCACPSSSGLVLGDDGRTCILPDNFLLYTSLDDGTIMMMSLNSGASRIPTMFAQSSRPSAVDFDPINKVVYWSDVAMGAIYRKPMNESPVELFLQDGIGAVDGLCIDWINKHLYFTNIGTHRGNVPYHRIEMIDLRDKSKRKIITTAGLDKPRDLVIDNESGDLYVSDWGIEPKVIRLDLNGQNPRVLPIKVANPNGLTYHDKYLYITDSHRRSGIVQSNGTIIYRQSPKLIRYDTVLELEEEVDTKPVDMELPFGLTTSGDHLYLTDWDLGGIYDLEVGGSGVTELIVGVQRPTGLKYATMHVSDTITNACTGNSNCNDMCVSSDEEDFMCLCSDQSGKTQSDNNNGNCVVPDSFLLVADGNRIVMKSLQPLDPVHHYAVIETYDPLASIVAVTFDPVHNYVYWVDNGRQELNRRALHADGNAEIETIYKNIGQADGLALDPVNRLIYWTDVQKGTIELWQLNTFTHSTVLKGLDKPRAITLSTTEGMMYWTEWGDKPMVAQAKMNGQDFRPLLSDDLTWPNSLFYDDDSDKLFFADGGTLRIQSTYTGRSAGVMDYMDLTGDVEHMFGLVKDKKGVDTFIFSDWKNRTIKKVTGQNMDVQVLMKEMIHPSQIYLQDVYTHSRQRGPCQPLVHQCSHICIPDKGDYACLCPDHLVLANDLLTCVTEEEAALYTSPAPTTTPMATTANSTTALWADKITTQALTTQPETTTPATGPDPDNELVIDLGLTTAAAETTSQPVTISNTTAMTAPITTAVLLKPQFINCDELATYQVALPKDGPFVAVTPELLGLAAVDGLGESINATVIDNNEIPIPFLKVRAGNEIVHFRAFDENGQVAHCVISLTIIDETPPSLVDCPQDILAETYSGKSVFVQWDIPTFEDNSDMVLNVTYNHEPGFFESGIYYVTYLATDPYENSAKCEFQVAVNKNPTKCGMPYVPENSKLSCTSNQNLGEQKCQVICDKGYRLTLADPFIKCQTNQQSGINQWLPFLDNKICKKPEVGNVQQLVRLTYPSPCKLELDFYEKRHKSIATSLKKHSRCSSFPRLGFCNNWKRKISLECLDQKKLVVNVTVDLAELKRVQTTERATFVVTRGAIEVADMAGAGKIVATGSDQKRYKAQFEEIQFSSTRVVCKKGYIVDKDGCVICPKGTYLDNDTCKFCPADHYQDKLGQVECHKCPPNKATATYGAMNVRDCKLKETSTAGQTSNDIVIGGTVGGAILLIALLILVGFVHWRRKNNNLKKEQERKRRQKEARERRRRKQASKAMETRSAEEADGSKGASGKAAANSDVLQQAVSNDDDKVPQPKIRMQIQEIPKFTELKKGANQQRSPSKDSSQSKVLVVDVTQHRDPAELKALRKSKRSENLDSVSQSGASVVSAVSGTSVDDDGRSTGAESAIFTDGGASDTVSVVSTEKPLKSALKKRPRPPPSDGYLEDDMSTVISASTISLGRLRKMQGRRPTSLDEDFGRTGRRIQRERQTQRSASMRRPESISPTKFMPAGANPYSAQPLPMKRVTSMERHAAGYDPRIAPRRNGSALMRSASPGQARMPRPMDNYLMSGPRGPQPARRRAPVYAAFAPRAMPPPGHVPYHPAAPVRDPYMTLPAGARPMQGHPLAGGYWNGAYDGNKEWNMPTRNDVDMRPPSPQQTMTLQRSMPRYRMPGGMIPSGPHHHMPPHFAPRMQQPPPPYYA